MGSLRRRNATVIDVFRDNVRKHPNRVIFYHNSAKWTFKELDEYSNRVANCLTTELGLLPGDEIALLMESRPEFVAMWLGAAKAGVITALINSSQRNETLVHSITVVECQALIFSAEYDDGKKMTLVI